MKAKNYLHAPKRMKELWPWVIAIDAWDYCDPGPLAELVEKSEIPPEFRHPVASIVSGDRQPRKKAAAKLKIQPSERMKIAGSLSTVIGLIDVFSAKGTSPSLEENAAKHAVEPIEEIRELADEREKVIRDAANECGVSIETIENLLRDLRKKIKSWPDI